MLPNSETGPTGSPVPLPPKPLSQTTEKVAAPPAPTTAADSCGKPPPIDPDFPLSSGPAGTDKPTPAAAERESGSFESRNRRNMGPLAQRSSWFQRTREYWDTRRTPAFLLSLILHTLVLLALAIWSVSTRLSGLAGFDFQAVVSSERNEHLPLEILAAGDRPPPPTPVQDVPSTSPNSASASATTTLSELLEVRQPQHAEQNLQSKLQHLLLASSSHLSAAFSSTGVDGRLPEQRQRIALARGGTLESEQAVERALAWLAEHQLPNGAWSLVHSGSRCNGRCRNDGSQGRFDTAATGLSLLAFLGAGYTHRDGKYAETVRRGVYFLLQVQEERPEGGSFLYQSDRGMYNHGIASFALCEAFQLTRDEELRKAAQDAVDFIVSAQNYRGGWGYLPKQPGDLTISGWQIMALKSAYAAELEMPATTILKLDPFLDSQQADSGIFYGYRKAGRNPTCSCIGLLVRLFRGMPHTDPRILDGADYFRRKGHSNGDAYFNYYATLFLFHVGGPFWDDWNPKMREHLINTQSTDGHESGSWYFDNPYGKEGGRLYTTAMGAMTLEVYYRFSPLYQQVDVDFKL